MKKIALLFILVFLPMLACADAVEIDGIYYTLVPDSKVAEVTSNPNKYTGEITIPATIEYDGEVYGVTAIGDNAFYDCKNITSVTIGNSVESIGHYAFAGCGRLASLTIPNSVGTIGNSAFSLCNGLRSLTIGNSVTSIGRSTFNGCSSLSSVIIPNGVTSIGDYAFQQCIGMASVTIPNSVTSIGKAAFLGCGLTSVTIPNSVKSIGDKAFGDCQRVTSIIVEDGNPVYDSRNNSNAIIETASNRLIAGCNNTTIPNGVTSIGNYAFQKCLFLTSVIIPSSVTSIGDGAFRDCRAVREIVNKARTPPVCGIQPFYGINISECKLYVPAASVSAYQAVEPWKNFKEIVALPAQDNYRPLVVEGKHWTYDNYMPLRPAEYDHYYYYDLRGDTLISGKKCLKMYSENRYNNNIVYYEAALYEDNKKVYCFFPGKDEAELLYDFDCKVGDTLQIYYPYNYQVLVKDIQTEDNGGIDVKKYTLKIIWDYEEEYVVWIEGVGAMMDFFGMLPAAGNYNSLKACELNGEKLYQYIVPDLTEKGYHKMGIEGKRWNYIHYYIDEDGEHRDPYSYVVKGDTIIRRTTYKKLWYQDEKTERFVCLLYESGRTISKTYDLGNNSNGEVYLSAFFWFDRDDFGRVFTWESKVQSGNTNWMVYGVDTINVNNRPFRRYTCLQKYSNEGQSLSTIAFDGEGVWHDIWVEGVGSATSGIEDQIPSHEPPVRQPNDYTYFVSCYEDGECIFTADDFNIQTKPVIDIAYRPFIEEGKVWKLGGDESGNPVRRVEYYYFDGDTIINGKTCKQMMCQRYISPNHPDYNVFSRLPSLSYVGAWYEEDKKVYFCNADNKQLMLWYDFSLDANETLQDNQLFVVGPRQTGGIKGFKSVYRDVMRLCWDEQLYNTTWLEGVGNIDGPIYSVYLGEEGHALFLMSCTVGDEVIYFNDEYEDGATPEELNARKQRIDFTHIIKIKPKSRREREEAAPSLYGEYNALQLGINLNPLDDAYVVRITDESGRVVYEKTVNAGNIVGLNIDISAYAEGRYTVTVENDDESFTGEIDTRTTGISLTPALQGDGAIYNLQGQRISTLRKGLNIVRGRKVFVK